MNSEVFSFLMRNRLLVGCAGVVFTMSLYNFLFCFSFLPLTEGWFSAYAHLILVGKVPYRDFYLFLTPFYPMALAGLTWLFGESFLMLRFVGVIISVGIALLLYLILAKRFSPPSAMLAAIVACTYYESGVAYIPYDFTQVLTLLTLASTWMLVQIACTQSDHKSLSWNTRTIYRFLLAGLFASLAFLTKQSNGAFVAVAAACCCIYLVLPSGKNAWRLIAAFCLGGLLPIIVVVSWLLNENALASFWSQIFGGALAAKGSLSHILVSWLGGLLTPVYLAQIETIGKYTGMLIITSVIINFLLNKLDRHIVKDRADIILISGFTIISIIVMAVAYSDSWARSGQIIGLGLQVNNYIIPIATSVSGFLLLLGVLGCFFKRLRLVLSPPFIIVGIMAIGMIWGNGTSAGLSEISVFTMVGIIIAALFDYKVFRYTGFLSAILLSVVLLFTFSSRKFEAPYAWWGVSEPDVREAIYSPVPPITHGIKVSLTTAEDIDDLSKSINTGVKGGDIFAFPNIPLVYLLGNRWPHSKVVVPWFDFLPDLPAKAEAVRLLANPPDTIVNLNLPDVAWDAHERLFRGGGTLGQRDILAAIKQLTGERGLYELDLRREVSPGCILEVWNKIPLSKD